MAHRWAAKHPPMAGSVREDVGQIGLTNTETPSGYWRCEIRNERAQPGRELAIIDTADRVQRVPHHAFRGGGTIACWVIHRIAPPSMTRVWPVIQAAASDTRKAIAQATSSGSPTRASGSESMRVCSCSRHSSSESLVRTTPGATAFTRTVGANSIALSLES